MVNTTIQVVVLAVIKKDSKYLFTLRNDGDSSFNGQWQIPGGGHEFGETTEETLHREVREELGTEVQIIRLIPHILTKVRDQWQGMFITYLCELKDPNSKIVLNEEASEYKWMVIEEMKEYEFMDGCVEIIEFV